MMPPEEVLVLAVTRMLAGVCTAGFTREPDPVTRLRWIRPVQPHHNLLLGDITDQEGRVIRPWDVVELQAQAYRPEPPHTEDWVCDFIHHRPRVLRRLEGERRARFLAGHLDPRPEDVLGPQPSRSLCLVQPDRVSATFELDRFSAKYEARLSFVLRGIPYPPPNQSRGYPVTDIKWRALGRGWLGGGGRLKLDHERLLERLGAQALYLALGLSRNYEGRCWPLVIGVHVLPDYAVEIDYGNL